MAGRWRAQEGAVESGVPALLAGAGWVLAFRLFTRPVAGRPLTELELVLLFGACALLTGWAMSRQVWLFGRRRPWTHVGWGVAGTALSLAVLVPLTRISWANRCTGELLGEVVSLATAPGALGAAGAAGATVACRVGGVPGNPYLPGTLVLPGWSGHPSLLLGGVLLAGAVLGALSFRDRRLRSTAVPRKLAEQLRYAPAQGAASSFEGSDLTGEVQACDNPTLWGEPCGQPYARDRVFERGEWCLRCQQVYTRCTRELELDIVTLFTGDLDVLNGLERLDTVSWSWGGLPASDARLSGQERWVRLGRMRFPDVLSVAQVLALVHARLGELGQDDRTREAARLASARMSRVAAWLWFGRVGHRLTYARPTREVRYGLGSQRLRDLVPGLGEALTLQLDIGLLPVELRMGFQRRFLDPGRADVVQNSKLDVWVPVGPADPREEDRGIWVARVEGEALRTWLGTERLAAPGARGVSSPLPYARSGEAPEGPPEPRPGSLDLVRRALDLESGEPVKHGPPGASIAEWDWLEWEQIELLRRDCLVLVSEGRGGR